MAGAVTMESTEKEGKKNNKIHWHVEKSIIFKREEEKKKKHKTTVERLMDGNCVTVLER